MEIYINKNPDILSDYKFCFILREENKKGEVKQRAFCCKEGNITYQFNKRVEEFKRANFININED